jgi:hypothetical protein
MAININSNMALGSAQYLDARQSVADLDALLALDTNIIPNGFECYVEALDCKYKYHEDYNETNTRHWKKITEIKVDTALNDWSSNPVQNKVIYEKFNSLNPQYVTTYNYEQDRDKRYIRIRLDTSSVVANKSFVITITDELGSHIEIYGCSSVAGYEKNLKVVRFSKANLENRTETNPSHFDEIYFEDDYQMDETLYLRTNLKNVTVCVTGGRTNAAGGIYVGVTTVTAGTPMGATLLPILDLSDILYKEKEGLFLTKEEYDLLEEQGLVEMNRNYYIIGSPAPTVQQIDAIVEEKMNQALGNSGDGTNEQTDATINDWFNE